MNELVDATGTRRRIQALGHAGWPLLWLADRLGMDATSLVRLMSPARARVQARTALLVRDLYEELRDVPPPAASSRDRAAVTAARKRAREAGWHPASAWGDGLDDPQALPGQGTGSHESAAADTVRGHLNRLLELGWKSRRIAAAAGVGEHTVYLILSTAGHRPDPQEQDALLALPLQPCSQDLVERLATLLTLGWTRQSLARQTGVKEAALERLARGRQDLTGEAAAALRMIPLVAHQTSISVDSCGTRRRVKALACMGWPIEELARRAGLSGSRLQGHIRPHRQVPYDLALTIGRIYEELREQTGPSEAVAGRAYAAGHVPPSGWPDERIDDPSAGPDWVPQLPHPEEEPQKMSDHQRWSWQDDAACDTVGLDLFYDRDGESRHEKALRETYALEICSECPVRTACLEHALTRPERYGIWGGMTEDGRKKARRRESGRRQAREAAA